MKNTAQWKFGLLLLLQFVFCTYSAVRAQINVNVQISPPYQSRISEYASRPDLMMVLVTNTSMETHEVQLTATLTGDNGISANVMPGYRSPQPIIVGPGAVVNLTGTDVAALFSSDQVEYTGITWAELTRGIGLREGRYQLCVRALDYNTHEPLSPDQPIGCTPITITNADPPRILMPMNEQVVNQGGAQQVFSISWSTPPGSSPMTQYKVKVVEIMDGRDPNDAMEAAVYPSFFEETVATNALVYGPAHPQLTPGRQYALMVQAIDPQQAVFFRNEGKSEVIRFTYMQPADESTEGLATATAATPRVDRGKQHATHSISGRFFWAFKAGEAQYTVPAGSVLPSVVPNMAAVQQATRVNDYLGFSPVQVANATALAQQDPTLQALSTSGLASAANAPGTQSGAALPAQLISANTASSLAYDYRSTDATPSGDRYPLANATVLIRGANKSSDMPSLQPVDATIASGSTDGEGKFNIAFLHPDYAALADYEKIILSVHVPGFTSYEQELGISELFGTKPIDIGEHVLTANTYRMALRIVGENSTTTALKSGGLSVRWLRAASALVQHPYLHYEGNRPQDGGEEVMVNGRRYVTVATDNMPTGQAGPGAIALGVSKLFYHGELLVQIESDVDGFASHTATVRLTDPHLAPSQVLEASLTYELELASPKVGGEVLLQAGDQVLPVKGAVVQVDFDPGDVADYAAGALVSIYTDSTPNHPASSLTVPQQNGTMPPMAAVSGTGANTATSLELVSVTGSETTGDAPPDINSAYTVTTDSTGQFLIGDLPVLTAGASYSVKVLHVPAAYRDLPMTPEDGTVSFMASKGEISRHSFRIQAESVLLVGRVVDAAGKPVSAARLHFNGSGTYFETGESGLFQTSHYAGTHTLTIEKNGYLAREVPVEVKKPQNTVPASEVLGDPAQIQANFQNTTTVSQAASAGGAVTPAAFGWAGSTSGSGATASAFQASVSNALHYNSATMVGEDVQDLGDLGPLERRVGKVRFELLDGDTGDPLPGVQVQLYDTIHATDSEGLWNYEGFGGNVTVTFTPAPGMPYYAIQRSVDIPETGAWTTVTIHLEKGVRVFGTVTSDDVPVADANISVEGSGLFYARSDEHGGYELVLPTGESTLRAAKTGYVGDAETHEIAAETEIQVDFQLGSGNGKNISSLLGFAIELDEAVPSGDGETWSGRFVDLQPVPELFADDKTHELAFSDVKVTFDADGNALPENDEVTTDETYLRFKLFGYLPVVMSDIDGKNKPIKVRQHELGLGTIRGELSFDYQTIFRGASGIRFPEADDLFIRLQDSIAVADFGLEIFRPESASLATEIAFRLLKAQGDSLSVKLFGFDVSIDLTKSRITSQGLEMSGTLYTPELGPVDAMAIHVESLRISKAFDVEEVVLASDDVPELKVGYFTGQLSSVIFNENGFKLGGKLVAELPSMEAAEIDFSNLRLAHDALFGGEFHFPSAGFDVFQVATITPGDAPLSFGRLGNTSIYSVSGSATIAFKKLFESTIDLQAFQIRSDGQFDLTAATDYEASLPFAKINIESISVGYEAGNSPYVAVKGGLKLSVRMVELEASTITFRPGATGTPTFSTGTITGRVNAPIVTIGLTVGISDEGIEGGGELVIPGTEIGASVDFHYRKLAGGFDVGASFTANAKIVLGVVEINELGGGFTYNSADSKFTGTLQGNASITGMSAAVSLQPVKLTVTDGPVVMGTADLVVAEKLNVAEAAITLDFREKFFSVAIRSQIEPLEGVASALIEGLLRIKWAPQESYVFLGTTISVKLAGFAQASGSYVLAVNVKNPKTRNDDLAGYFTMLDDTMYGSGTTTTFSGIYIHFTSNVGVPKDQAKSINLVIIQGRAWFHASAEVMLLLNFGANDYRFRFAGSLGAGAEGCILSKLCVGAEFNACFAFEGGYNNMRGWFLSGKAAGEFAAHIGCSADCNKLGWAGPFPCGVRICVGAHASFELSTRDRNRFSVGLGRNADGNLCL